MELVHQWEAKQNSLLLMLSTCLGNNRASSMTGELLVEYGWCKMCFFAVLFGRNLVMLQHRVSGAEIRPIALLSAL